MPGARHVLSERSPHEEAALDISCSHSFLSSMAPGDDATERHVNTSCGGLDLLFETPSIPASNAADSNTCVICLDEISEPAVALPCNHDQFDFPCLGTWVQKSHSCPLCKAEVKAIKYDVDLESNGSKLFHLPPRETSSGPPQIDSGRHGGQTQRYRPYNHRRRTASTCQGRARASLPTDGEHPALEFRKRVYRRKMFSAYVGANRISRYHNITPETFTTSPALVTRAKAFIRRELQVFDFLNPSSTMPSASTNSSNRDRRANNAEFLLEYIIGILKSVDLKGSTGQAEDLLKDFLGRDNTRLFLHELEAWLRSPYERLADWDRHVQYGNIVDTGHHSRDSTVSSRSR